MNRVRCEEGISLQCKLTFTLVLLNFIFTLKASKLEVPTIPEPSGAVQAFSFHSGCNFRMENFQLKIFKKEIQMVLG